MTLKPRKESSEPDRPDEQAETNEQLRARVNELTETLAAIQRGDVDALVVNTSGEEQLFTLHGADAPYRIFVEQMREGALTLDISGVILFANQRFADMLGFPLERTMGALLRDFAASDGDRARLAELLKTGNTARSELNLTNSANATFPVYVTVSSLAAEDDARHCVVITDLTEQKKAELVATSERKHRLMTALNDAVLGGESSGTDLAERIVQVIVKEFNVSRCVLARIEPDEHWVVQQEATRQGVQPLIGRVDVASFGPKTFEVELREGRTIAVNDTENESRLNLNSLERLRDLNVRSLLYVPHPPDQNPPVVLALHNAVPRVWSVEDLALMEQAAERVWSALKAERAATELRSSEDRFRQLADTIPQLAWMARGDGWIYWYNHRWYEYTGTTPEQMQGWGWQAVHDPDTLPKVMERWHRSIATGEPFDMEFPIRGADGKFRPFLALVMPLKDAAGKVVQWFGTNTDVSQQHQIIEERNQLLAAERTARNEAERVSRMKDEFVSTLSHELRTPLNAILGWAQIISQGRPSDEDLSQGLEVIQRNTRVQVQMIEDLLDMSRITSGKVRLDVKRLGFCSVIEAAIESIRPAADVKGIRIQKLLDCEADQVNGDANRLQQVVWNLLTNAVKFTQKDGRIQVLLERVNSHVELSVADNGRGITSDFLPQVFDRFRQADSSTTRQVGGLGLGLAIVKQLVELHGGTIKAKSPGLGQGATFIVSLPLTLDRRPAASNTPIEPSDKSDENADRFILDGIKVVYVDDEPDARDLVKRVLADHGATVFTGGSAAEGRTIVLKERPDLIVADIGMPEEDGYSFIRSIRALPADRGGTIPAAAVTALARSEDRRRALLAGFQTHVAKPVEPAELVAVVASLVGRTGRPLMS